MTNNSGHSHEKHLTAFISSTTRSVMNLRPGLDWIFHNTIDGNIMDLLKEQYIFSVRQMVHFSDNDWHLLGLAQLQKK